MVGERRLGPRARLRLRGGASVQGRYGRRGRAAAILAATAVTAAPAVAFGPVFDLTGSELLRLGDRGVPFEIVARSRVRQVIGRP
jgi:hypothetical protein